MSRRALKRSSNNTPDVGDEFFDVARAKLRFSSHVCFVPIADSCTAAKTLFNHLVGNRKYARRNDEPKRLGGLQIDGEFKLGRSPHWQIGGFGTVEDFADVDAALAIGFGEASAIGTDLWRP